MMWLLQWRFFFWYVDTPLIHHICISYMIDMQLISTRFVVLSYLLEIFSIRYQLHNEYNTKIYKNQVYVYAVNHRTFWDREVNRSKSWWFSSYSEPQPQPLFLCFCEQQTTKAQWSWASNMLSIADPRFDFLKPWACLVSLRTGMMTEKCSISAFVM